VRPVIGPQVGGYERTGCVRDYLEREFVCVTWCSVVFGLLRVQIR
jgi:hypothetical protein